MGRYNVRTKQDLSGIATLTHDPITLDNIRACIWTINERAMQIKGVAKSVQQTK